MIVYKKVRISNITNEYKSAFVNWNWRWDGSNSAIEATYRIGEKTVPPISGSYLYAFMTKQRADEWHTQADYNSDDGMAILKCEAQVIRRKPKIVPLDEALAYWKQKEICAVADAPDGTIWCKWIKPIELVE